MQNAPHTLCGAFFYGVGAAERGTGMSGGACRPHRAGWGTHSEACSMCAFAEATQLGLWCRHRSARCKRCILSGSAWSPSPISARWS